MKTNIIEQVRETINSKKTRSAWDRGVKVYALELLDGLKEAIDYGYFDADDLVAPKLVKKALLNGAKDWSQYSWGGCTLCYDYQIAERLCAPWELKKTDNGNKKPNSREEWLDVQARALRQASYKVMDAIRSNLI